MEKGSGFSFQGSGRHPAVLRGGFAASALSQPANLLIFRTSQPGRGKAAHHGPAVADLNPET
jgi:hypothetical protein